MTKTNPALPRSLVRTACILAGVLVLALPVSAQQSSSSEVQTMADKAPALPLTPNFEKVANAENGPYKLTLKNDAKEAVKASAKVLLAVAFHADSKARNLPEQQIDAGKSWTIPDLSSGDKVIVTAKGYAPLELVVP